MRIPAGFTAPFLDWFRQQTEQAWSTYQSEPFEAYVAAGVGGEDWQRGTMWLHGLSEAEIEQVERQWVMQFPPDYRLFLRQLHVVDRPMQGARYLGDKLTPVERPSFRNWLTDTHAIHDAISQPLDGLLFDVEYGDVWLAGWGPKPAKLEAQKECVRALAANAPALIPIIGNRYLPSASQEEGNPVLSISQSDIVLYAPDLRLFFLDEFAGLLGIKQKRMPAQQLVAAARKARRVPFWGEVYEWNMRTRFGHAYFDV